MTGSDARALALGRTLVALGATPVSFSDTTGSIVDAEGFDANTVAQLESMLANRGRLQEFRHVSRTASFHDSTESVWTLCPGAEVAFPTTSTNEVNADDAAALADNGCKVSLTNNSYER